MKALQINGSRGIFPEEEIPFFMLLLPFGLYDSGIERHRDVLYNGHTGTSDRKASRFKFFRVCYSGKQERIRCDEIGQT